MAESNSSISALGQSLLTEQRERNESLYKQQKREAYKIALATGGIEFINKNLQNNVNSFLQEEQVLAARVKQNQGYEDAKFAIAEKAKIDASGMTAKDYFSNQYAVQAKQIGIDQLKAAGIQVNDGSYNVYLRDITNKIAEERAAKFEEFHKAAIAVESPQDFTNFQILRNTRPTSAFGALFSAIKNSISGKTKQELDNEAIDAITNSPSIKRAETTTALRNIYSGTGDLSLAIKVADAIESGRIAKDTTPPSYERVGSVETVKGTDGRSTSFVTFQKINSNGKPVLDDTGQPILVTKNVFEEKAKPEVKNVRRIGDKPVTITGPSGEEISYWPYEIVDGAGNAVLDDKGQPMMINHDINVGKSNTPSSLTRVIKTLKPEDVSLMEDNFRGILTTATDAEKSAFDQYQLAIGGGKEDDKGNVEGANLKSTMTRWAANSKLLETEVGMPKEDAQRLMSQVFLNRLNETVNVKPGSGFLFFGGDDTVTTDLTKVNFAKDPSPLEMMDAVFSLAGGAFEVTPTDEQLSTIVQASKSDFAGKPAEEQARILDRYAANPEKYAALFIPDPSGVSIYDLLVANSDSDLRPAETKDSKPTTTQVVDPSLEKISKIKGIIDQPPVDKFIGSAVDIAKYNAGAVASIPIDMYRGAVAGTTNIMEFVSDSSLNERAANLKNISKTFDAYEKSPGKVDIIGAVRDHTNTIQEILTSTQTSPEAKDQAKQALSTLDEWLKTHNIKGR